MQKPLALGVALVLLGSGCAPNDPAPVKTTALTFDPTTQKYQLTQVSLTTITELTKLQGTAAHFIGGAQIVVDATDPALQAASTDEAVKAAVLKGAGGDVQVHFIKSGDVEWPADFDSINMVTLYFNLETALTFYKRFGWTDAQAGVPDVYYGATFTEPQLSPSPIKDNALYFTPLQGFLVLPFQNFQEVPLAMNVGIIGHEYSHYQLATRVFGRAVSPAIYDTFGAGTGTASPAANLLKSLDEGFADFFGTGVTCGPDFDHCDPNFLAQSVSSVAVSRDLSGKHCLDQTLNTHLLTDPLDAFVGDSLHYDVGTVLASAMWRAANDGKVVAALGPKVAIQKTMQTLYSSLDDPSINNPGLNQILQQIKGLNRPDLFTIDYTVANMIVAHAADPTLGTALCSAFMDRIGTNTNAQCVRQCTGLEAQNANSGCICACQKYGTAAAYGECAQ